MRMSLPVPLSCLKRRKIKVSMIDCKRCARHEKERHAEQAQKFGGVSAVQGSDLSRLPKSE